LGVTPSAWNTNFRALQFGGGASLWNGGAGVASTYVGNNYFLNSGGNRVYIADGTAAEYAQLTTGVHAWYTAPSGTAGNAISFGDAKMTLDASGRLLVGTTSSPSQQAVIYRTSATTSNGALLLDGDGSYAGVQFASSGTLRGSIGVDSSAMYFTHGGDLIFKTGATNNVGGTERARISSDGTFRVKGAGTAGSTDAVQFSGSAPASVLTLDAGGRLYLGAISSALANQNILTGGQGGGVQLIRNASTLPTSGQSLGTFAWKGSDSANTNVAAEAMIEAVAAETFTGSTAATDLLFYTKLTGTGPGSAPTERARITSTGNFVAGNQAALATTATDGFLYVPTCAGTPTGVPTAITGMAPIVVNTTNNKLYFYSGGAWRDAGP
jgi:hypothetical protein